MADQAGKQARGDLKLHGSVHGARCIVHSAADGEHEAYLLAPLLEAPLLEAPLVEAPLDEVKVADAEQRRADALEGAAVLLGRGRRSPSA